MKKITTILLLAVIISLTFKDFITYADFFINRNFIATYLCVNRDKPASNCNGKCYLAKKIKESEEQEKEIPNKTIEQKSNTIFLPICKVLPLSVGFDKNKRELFFYSADIHSFPYLKEVFHPPQLS